MRHTGGKMGTLARLAAAMLVSLTLAACAGASATGGGPAQARGDDGLLAVADNTLAAGDLGTALKLYREAATAQGGSARALTRYGQVLFQNGQYDLAAGAYAEALARSPNDREILTRLGVAQLAQGRLDDAERSLGQVVRDGADARAVRNLAVLRLMQGQPEEAHLILDKAVRRWPRDLDLKANFALSEAIDGGCEGALAVSGEMVSSPFARAQHVAAHALTLALCGDEVQARDFAREVMSETGADALLDQARVTLAADGPVARAIAIGVVPMQASGVMAAQARPPPPPR